MPHWLRNNVAPSGAVELSVGQGHLGKPVPGNAAATIASSPIQAHILSPPPLNPGEAAYEQRQTGR